MSALQHPLEAHVVEGDVFVSDPLGGSEIWMTPEAVLASLAPLQKAANAALAARHGKSWKPALIEGDLDDVKPDAGPQAAGLADLKPACR